MILRRKMIILGMILAFFPFSQGESTDNPKSSSEFEMGLNDLSDFDLELLNNGTTITHYNASNVMEGLTLFENVDGTIYMINSEGNIVGGKKNAGDPEFVDATTLMYSHGPRGEQNISLWDLKTNITTDYPVPVGHHDIEYNPLTETFLTIQSINLGTYSDGTANFNSTPVKYDDIVEYNKEGAEIWRWNCSENIPFDASWFLNESARGTADWTHTNTIFWDIEEGMIYYNPRNLDTFYKIDKSTSEIVWSLGKYGDFQLFNINGVEIDSLFYHPHALEKISPTKFLLYDNDFYNKTLADILNLTFPLSRDGSYIGKTRVLEITINESAKTAEETWSWTYKDYFASKWGDADRLPNGNTLACFGDNDDSPARITEITPNGEIAWEVLLNDTEGSAIWGVYRAERILSTPYIQIEKLAYNYTGNDLNISMQVSDSYRARYATPGTIQVRDLDNTILGKEEFTFLPYWQLTPLDLNSTNFENLSSLEPGIYDLILSIDNEAGLGISIGISLTISNAKGIEGYRMNLFLVSGLIAICSIGTYKKLKFEM